MLLPPPNVTGRLHIGHALTVSIQDAIARFYRMKGFKVSWIPGTDHAGIGTQTVVERKMLQEQGLTRHDISREEFLGEIWKFQKEHGNVILEQLEKLGASVDWKRKYFTLDNKHSQTVQSAFIDLFKQGLIYRDTRIVNWCPALETAISDIEVEEQSITDPAFIKVPNGIDVEVGVMYRIAYPIVGSETEELIVATTRPETVLGDAAIAINPNDSRYKQFLGKRVQHPLLDHCQLLVVGDSELVDPKLGTGVVKVTPAHDASDYACYLRQRAKGIELQNENIFNSKGYIKDSSEWKDFSGLHRFDARSKILQALERKGFMRGKTSHPCTIKRCSRSGDIIEPWLCPQWFLKVSDMGQIACDAVKSGLLKLVPESFSKDWERWLVGIQDWCISRQLVWGHRIPAYHIQSSTFEPLKNGIWLAGECIEDIYSQIRSQFPHPDLEKTLMDLKIRQDADVLDTWFSSALLPLSTTGWQDSTLPLTRSPTNLLETGSDILFFWVARMVMLCHHFSGQLPFDKVLLHPMIRDRHGRKMSKSLGNVIDPLDIIEGKSLLQLQTPLNKATHLPLVEVKRSLKALALEFPEGIPSCGADSLRFALLTYLQQGRQINLNIDSVVASSHFSNKLWNLVRFYLQRRLSPITSCKTDSLPPLSSLSLLDKYILSKLAGSIIACHSAMESLTLCQIPISLRHFVVEVLGNCGVEFARPILAKKTPEAFITCQILGLSLDSALRLLHPVMPFITETLWQHLHYPKSSPGSLMLASLPNLESFSSFHDLKVEKDFELVRSVIHGARSLRQTHQLSHSDPLPFQIIVKGSNLQKSVWFDADGAIQLYLQDIKVMAHMESLLVSYSHEATLTGFHHVLETSDSHTVYLQVSNTYHHQIDLAKLTAKVNKIQAKLVKLDKQKLSILSQIQDSNYATRVPLRVQNINLQRLADIEAELQTNFSNLQQTEALLQSPTIDGE